MNNLSLLYLIFLSISFQYSFSLNKIHHPMCFFLLSNIHRTYQGVISSFHQNKSPCIRIKKFMRTPDPWICYSFNTHHSNNKSFNTSSFQHSSPYLNITLAIIEESEICNNRQDMKIKI